MSDADDPGIIVCSDEDVVEALIQNFSANAAEGTSEEALILAVSWLEAGFKAMSLFLTPEGAKEYVVGAASQFFDGASIDEKSNSPTTDTRQ